MGQKFKPTVDTVDFKEVPELKFIYVELKQAEVKDDQISFCAMLFGKHQFIFTFCLYTLFINCIYIIGSINAENVNSFVLP